jgi:hypothetical protein
LAKNRLLVHMVRVTLSVHDLAIYQALALCHASTREDAPSIIA